MDKPKAVTAAAHKLARLIYTMLTKGKEYTDQGQDYWRRALSRARDAGAVPARRQVRYADGSHRATGLKTPFQITHWGGVSCEAALSP